MKKKFKIEWMTCASCVALNQNSLEKLNWVSKVSINLATLQANIDYDENLLSFEKIRENIESNWFKVNDNIKKQDENSINNIIFKRFIFSAVFSSPVFLMMFGDFMIWISYFWVDLLMYIYAILSFLVVFIFWWHFHKRAFKSLLKLHFNMDSLVSLGTLAAFFYSVIAMFFKPIPVYFEAAVSIITLINLWKYLEHKSKLKAWDAIWKLLKLWAKKAFVKIWDDLIEKNIDDIKVWEIIIVKAWEKIALDGEILEWNANIDESMLTWESIAIYKKEWDSCFGWTINLDGNISLKVTKQNSSWVLANIIKMVEQAQSSKAPIEHLADKVSFVFVPIIIVISIITFISWFLITWDISKAIINSVTCLIIACPCALWLATPTAIMVWTWVWAKNWILIKNAQALEKTKNIDIVVFDKTWTLTNWKPEIIDLIPIEKKEKELLGVAKSLSSLSNHPFSIAIDKYDYDSNILEVSDFEEIKWKWLSWIIDWEKIMLWNKKLFSNINDEISSQIEKLTNNWKTPIIVWTKNNIFWIIWLIDLPKNWVKQVVETLKSIWIQIVMLTWDTKKTAQYIANEISIDINNVIAEVMPDDKLNVIKKLQNDNKKVAFVWDGINDAPALVQSDLSIAMWTWSDIAIESSHIVLVGGSLQKVVWAINLSRRTLWTIKQNLFWAFIYNTLWIPLAAFWLLNPIFAAFAMSMSSFCVVSNSLRLKRFRL